MQLPTLIPPHLLLPLPLFLLPLALTPHHLLPPTLALLLLAALRHPARTTRITTYL